jgi:DNA (cytosine-5)-methyltransferase 1
MREVGRSEPFLIVYYGSDGAGGWQRVDRPLRTITTVDRFAYVRPSESGHQIRMLQVPELRRAMGFPDEHIFVRGTRRDRIKLLGNAVCPPVMEAVVRSLTGNLDAAR